VEDEGQPVGARPLIGEWLAAGRPMSPNPSISDLTIKKLAIAYVKYAVG
jgi:hypothetical protein